MWEDLYETYHKELVRYASRMCGSEEVGQDMVQETFLKALQSGDVFEDLGPSQRRAWLYRTMKNLIFDRFRRNSLETDYINSLSPETVYDEQGIQRMENELLLAELSQEDRVLFHLRYEEGYNASELAELFGIPAGTIRARLSRSRKLLKKLLSE